MTLHNIDRWRTSQKVYQTNGIRVAWRTFLGFHKSINNIGFRTYHHYCQIQHNHLPNCLHWSKRVHTTMRNQDSSERKLGLPAPLYHLEIKYKDFSWNCSTVSSRSNLIYYCFIFWSIFPSSKYQHYFAWKPEGIYTLGKVAWCKDSPSITDTAC